MAFWTSPKSDCLCWIEAIYDITDSFHCSYSCRSAGCTLSQLGLITFSRKRGNRETAEEETEDNYKVNDASGYFTAETGILHSSGFQDLTKDIWSDDVLWTHSRNQSFERLVVLRGFQEPWTWLWKADMLAEMNLIHLPVLCSTSVKLVNVPGLILA